MAGTVNMTYGTGGDQYDFATQAGPIPFLTINTIHNKSNDGSRIGTLTTLTIDGTLTPLPDSGSNYLLLDSMQDALLDGFSVDGKKFNVTCDGSDLILSYPRINSITLNPSNNNWVQTTPYTIELEWDGSGISGDVHLQSAQENWNVNIRADASKFDWVVNGSGDTNSTVAEVSHELSAQGLAHYENGILVKPAWEHARDWVLGQLGRDTSVVDSSGVLNLQASDFSGLNHIRVENRDILGGSFGVTENWTELDHDINGGAGTAIEDFTASLQFDINNGLTSVDIAGSIQGLETVTYGTNPGDYTVATTKWENASGSWDIIRPRLYNRATVVLDGSINNTYNRTINPVPNNFSVAHNPSKGTINYNYTYNDRVCNFISNAISENINVTDVYPTDVFASLTVLGRLRGPVLQPISTVTSSKRNVNIDVIVRPTGCTPSLFFSGRPKTDVETFLCAMQNDISGAGVQMFKSSDQDNWNPRTGRYTRSVEWTYTNCINAPPDTNFC